MFFIFLKFCQEPDFICLFFVILKVLRMLNMSRTVKLCLLMVVSILIYGYGNYQYRAGKSAAETAQYVADLEQFKKQMEQLQLVSAHILQTSERLNVLTDDILKEYNNEITQNPLPINCVISDGRVRLINDIIRESTATRQSGSDLPSRSATK